MPLKTKNLAPPVGFLSCFMQSVRIHSEATTTIRVAKNKRMKREISPLAKTF